MFAQLRYLSLHLVGKHVNCLCLEGMVDELVENVLYCCKHVEEREILQCRVVEVRRGLGRNLRDGEGILEVRRVIFLLRITELGRRI